MKAIDLRSDTVTLPSPEMWEAMCRAELGDDVYGEDPTVNRLQEMAAERMGKEAALFVASGTMGNLTCVLAHCARGDEAIMGHLAHTFLFEAGGSAAVGGIHPRTVPNQPDGTLLLEDVEAPFHAHVRPGMGQLAVRTVRIERVRPDTHALEHGDLHGWSSCS